MRVEFNQKGTWQAKEAAEAWCQANGISVGQSSADGPLTPQERANLHGTMDGEFREGPVIVTLKDSAVEAHAACLKAETTASAAA